MVISQGLAMKAGKKNPARTETGQQWGSSLHLTYRALSEAILQLCALELGSISPSEVQSLAFHHICHHPSLKQRSRIIVAHLVGVSVVPVVRSPTLTQPALPCSDVGVAIWPSERPKSDNFDHEP